MRSERPGTAGSSGGSASAASTCPVGSRRRRSGGRPATGPGSRASRWSGPRSGCSSPIRTGSSSSAPGREARSSTCGSAPARRPAEAGPRPTASGSRRGPRPGTAPGLRSSRSCRSLFGEAATRTAAGADPVVENRAAILVAAAQAFGCTPVEGGQAVRPVTPALHRRDDLGRHFIASAALAALLDRGFSDCGRAGQGGQRRPGSQRVQLPRPCREPGRRAVRRSRDRERPLGAPGAGPAEAGRLGYRYHAGGEGPSRAPSRRRC